MGMHAHSNKALDRDENMLGVVVSKLEPHRGGPLRGYIAMLAVKKEHRGKGIATKLVRMAIDIMIERDADEVSQHFAFFHKRHELSRTRLPWRQKSLTQQQ